MALRAEIRRLQRVGDKNGTNVRLISRNRKDLSKRFQRIVDALKLLPVKACIIGGEIVCLDLQGRPCFEDLQNFTTANQDFLFFYAFDLLALNSTTLTNQPIEKRKQQLRDLLPKDGPVRVSDFINGDPEDLVNFAKEHRLEGIVAKRRGSLYEPGERSGVWTKFKTYQEGDFLIGGFLANDQGVESIVVGFHRERRFHYAAKLEVYLQRKQGWDFLASLVGDSVETCPFVDVPRKRSSGDTWSVGVTEEDLQRMIWVTPKRSARVKFVEWTRAGLRRQAGLLSV